MEQFTGAEIIRPDHSALFLPEDSSLVRLPHAPARKRTEKFYIQFENRAVFYDCFWHHETKSVLLIGPPPINLLPQYEAARFMALPSGKEVKANFIVSRSTMTTHLTEIPAGTNRITVHFADADYELEIQPNHTGQLAGARILFSMNKDNDLSCIADWAYYHVVFHRVDTVILFDNGSTRYGLDELETALKNIPGLKKVILFDWPHKFGRTDMKVWTYHFWAHFLQISSMGVVLRRMAMKADAILNCDIDELVAPIKGTDIFQLAHSSKTGIASLKGTWVENVLDSKATRNSAEQVYHHGDYGFVRRDMSKNLCPKKWVLDPKRSWVENLDVFPYWHRIMGAPDRSVSEKPLAEFWHFRGVGTGWKTTHNLPEIAHPIWHRRDKNLTAVLERFQDNQPSA